MNLEAARANMIARQIRPCAVLDASVLALFARVKREAFVPTACRALAFVDMELPLGHGQVMLEPKLEARFLQELKVCPTDRVLEIGAGSGFMAALLASRAEFVVSLEIEPALADLARGNLAAAGFANARVEIADGAKGYSTGISWDVIMISGAVPAIPDVILRQLRTGGRLAAIVGTPPAMRAQIVTATRDGYSTKNLFETETVPLRNFAASGFTF
jgi:protein-L-isoaspartate(D-aspartate) O-methyltransferase